MGIGGRAPGDSPDFSRTYPQALRTLDAAVHDLIRNEWDESSRRLAHDMAVALIQATKAAGCREHESVLRTLAALLDVSTSQAAAIRPALRDKTLELLGLLKKN